ncbi:unnamed protein product [Camellia sinensis]
MSEDERLALTNKYEEIKGKIMIKNTENTYFWIVCPSIDVFFNKNVNHLVLAMTAWLQQFINIDEVHLWSLNKRLHKQYNFPCIELLVAGGGMHVEVFNRGIIPLAYSIKKKNKAGETNTYLDGIFLLFTCPRQFLRQH